ncbi:MAG: YitT family protein [Acutalibacteraceae bacterium]|nr:YitT family protein [Acutalibacteraceae bacterium]
MKKAFSYFQIIFCAIVLAFVYYIFIVKNNFAPAGLNGIATMIQYKTGFSISYMSLLINIPLSVFAYFFVKKDFAVKTLLFSVVYSVAFLLLQNSSLTFIQYNALGHDTIYPVILSGVISGCVYGICFKNGASTGGTDVLSRYINKVRPDTNFFMVTFILNGVVAVSSVFVYSEGVLNYKPMALCILYCFISNFVGNLMLKSTKTAYKFTIITTHKDEFVEEITKKLHHGCTEIDAIGTYTGAKRSVLICIINKHQLNDFQKIVAKYDNTFSYFEVVNETYGNFKNIKQHINNKKA